MAGEQDGDVYSWDESKREGMWRPAPVGGSARVLYATRGGAALDTDLLTGGGTDDTVAIQALLDEAQAGDPIHVVIEAPALVGPLDIYSNTTLEFARGAGLFLAPGSNRTLIRNANPSASTVTDKNIIIRGGFLNGNSVNQTGIGLFGTQNVDGTLIGLIQLFGVEGVQIEHVHLYHSKTIACWLANVKHAYVNDVRIENRVAGQYQQGGLQIDGPAQFVKVMNIDCESQDDMFAVNTNDADWVNGSFTGLGPYIANGDIYDVVAVNLVAKDAYAGVRFFNSTNRIDRVRVSNIVGRFHQHLFNNDPINIGPGNVGMFVVDGANVSSTTEEYPDIGGLINIYGRAEHMVFRDVRFGGLVDDRPLVNLAGSADIDYLEINGLDFSERSTATSGIVPVSVSGKVQRMVMSNVSWNRDLFLGHATDFVKFQGANSQIEELIINGVRTNRVNNLVNVPTGRLGSVLASNVNQTDCNGGVTIRTQTTVGLVGLSNWYGHYCVPLHGSAITKVGDAFPVDTTAPTVTGALGTGSSPFFIVQFSEPVNSSNFTVGVTAKVNGTARSIVIAKRRDYDPFAVEFVLSSNTAPGDTLTWEYDGTGDYQDLHGNRLAAVAAYTVTLTRTGYVYDLFDAADGTAISGRTPAPMTAGNNWAIQVGTSAKNTIKGGRLHMDATLAAQSPVVNPGSANVIAYGTFIAKHLSNNTYGFGIRFRASDANNYWLYWVVKDAAYLFKVVAGSASVIDSVPSAAFFPGIPYVVVVILNGSSIICQTNGGSQCDTTDAFNSTAQNVGPQADKTIVAVDDWTVVSFA